MRSVRKLHRYGAIVVTLFVLAHLANHMAALGGIPAHLRFMEAARGVYRQPLVETLLLLGVAAQAGSGLRLLGAGWRRRSGWLASLQAASGAYLALFLLIHVSAVLFGRAVLDLDTNVHFAAAGLQAWPYSLFFVPYYFLAVLAVFTHLGCALARRAGPAPGKRAAALAVPMGVGVVLSSLVLAALMGKLYPYEVPQVYMSTYQAQASAAPP
jgi:succinate dehydrogenase/fumarate reductase cytochrome b subunit